MIKSPLERAIEICGSQTALAEKSGAKQVTVSAWMNRFNKKVGPDYVLAVAKATDYQVTPNQLRADLYPHPHDGLPEHLRAVAA